MDVSDLARRNAISIEVKKDGLTQRQSGDWQLRLTIAAIDMDSRITAAAMGTRFACVLVEHFDAAAIERCEPALRERPLAVLNPRVDRPNDGASTARRCA